MVAGSDAAAEVLEATGAIAGQGEMALVEAALATGIATSTEADRVAEDATVIETETMAADPGTARSRGADSAGAEIEIVTVTVTEGKAGGVGIASSLRD